MNVARAWAPWNGPGSGKKGRAPALAEKASDRCVWPLETDQCPGRRISGLAVCESHATLLKSPAEKACGWPNCDQRQTFKFLCAYHDKIAHGLLEKTKK